MVGGDPDSVVSFVIPRFFVGKVKTYFKASSPNADV